MNKWGTVKMENPLWGIFGYPFWGIIFAYKMENYSPKWYPTFSRTYLFPKMVITKSWIKISGIDNLRIFFTNPRYALPWSSNATTMSTNIGIDYVNVNVFAGLLPPWYLEHYSGTMFHEPMYSVELWNVLYSRRTSFKHQIMLNSTITCNLIYLY